MSSTRNSSAGQRGDGTARPPRPAPQRTCVGCRRTGDQGSFVRLVRGADEVMIDEGRRRAPGRGAYLCRRAACWERALQGPLGRALRTTIGESNRHALAAYGARFTETNTGSGPDGAAGRDDDAARQAERPSETDATE